MIKEYNWIWQLLLFLIPYCLQAQEWTELRGFLYQREDSTVILASQPDLKTCCLHPLECVVVELKEPFIPTNKAMSVQGCLIKKGNEWILTEGIILPPKKNKTYLDGLGLCGFIVRYFRN